ncbi:MAG: ribosome biogenesis GTP-binding protein YihA/YsxC [Nitrospinaceae bacterium]|jgi:GTP-binding protein|nr:YihA family ribosome biogenesis GTP-binding protein [Nitrospinaceae bacterium]HIK58300.1 YihA family ribosome biogenesis GTP-binding protein [Nitrospinaceae bacterium]
MKIVSTEFLVGAVSSKQYPKNPLPEFAFVGRSNVGKSSLIKSLLNRKKLVRISSSPGKTREINFFKINDAMMFADLPGYGFARVTPALQKKWKIMIEEYLSKREPLVAIVFIVDIRRNPTELDLTLKEWLEELDRDYILLITKADKISSSERQKQTKKIKAAFTGKNALGFTVYSSKNNTGRKELWSQLEKLARH